MEEKRPKSKTTKPKGKVYVWGWNQYSQLGLAEEGDNVAKPRSIPELEGESCVAVSCGDNFVAITTDRGRVFTWGLGSSGQLGHGDTDTGTFPRELPLSRKRPMLMAAAGDNHTLFLRKTGSVYCTGDGHAGKLGLSSSRSTTVPRRLPLKKKITAIACGSEHSVALTEQQSVLVWGSAEGGRLGNGKTEGRLLKPTPLSLKVSIKQVACGTDWTAFISTEGKLYTCGIGAYGRLGHGNDRNVLVPTEVSALSNVNVEAVACGTDHMACIADGQVFTWGCGGNGRLGHGNEHDVKKPRRVKALRKKKTVLVACGGYHMGAVTNEGKLYTWGWNCYGQCGLGAAAESEAEEDEAAKENQLIPALVTKLQHKRVLQVSFGEGHSVALVASE